MTGEEDRVRLGESLAPLGCSAWCLSCSKCLFSKWHPVSHFLPLLHPPCRKVTWRVAISGHKTTFFSSFRLSGSRGLTPKVHCAPGNGVVLSIPRVVYPAMPATRQEQLASLDPGSREGAGQTSEAFSFLFCFPATLPCWQPDLSDLWGAE
jgi:hypothetical protein